MHTNKHNNTFYSINIASYFLIFAISDSESSINLLQPTHVIFDVLFYQHRCLFLYEFVDKYSVYKAIRCFQAKNNKAV